MSDDKKTLKELSKIFGKEFSKVNYLSDTHVGLSYTTDEYNITGIALDLSKNDLDQEKSNLVRDIVKSLGSLKTFYIKYTEPLDWIYKLSQIEVLSLRNNNLTKIPDEIQNLKNLKSLNLATNNIVDLPDWLSELSDLKDLNLDHNKHLEWNERNLSILRNLKEKGGTITATRLFNFQLKYNLPKEQIEIIEKLERHNTEKEKQNIYVNPINIKFENGKLVYWKMFEYPLKTLPENFNIFKDLKSLIITKTALEVLPQSFGDLINLEVLDLSSNKLSELPDSFSNLILINKLNLDSNEFQEIPTQLWNLTELRELKLSNNPLSPEEETIIQKVPDLIREYLIKKATIKIFISHAVIDYEPYHIGKLVEFLKEQKEISEVYYCEDDLAGNIDKWMLDTVQKSQLILFIATKKSVFDSIDCQNELQLADKFAIPVIPLKGENIDWNDLGEINLSRELGIEYDKENFEDFSSDLYNYILNFKREINLMSKESRKQGITDIYERFRLMLDEELSKMHRKINQLEERIEELEK